MDCPACGSTLTRLDAGDGLMLDVCDGGCGGIWFDNQELKRIDEPHELPASPAHHVEPGSGGAPAVAWALDDGAAVTRAGGDATSGPKRSCPCCPGMKLRKSFYSAARQVEVDTCASCGGYWLDHGELEKIRAENGQATQRPPSAYEQAMFDVLKMEKAARFYKHLESHQHHRRGY